MIAHHEATWGAEVSPITIGTIVRGRRKHLENQARGIAAQSLAPQRWVIVSMNEPAVDAAAFSWDDRTEVCSDDLWDSDCPLPLAAARNRVCELAGSGLIIFLDVDCIPHPDAVSRFAQAIAQGSGLWMGQVGYLPPEAAASGWTFDTLAAAAQLHRLQPPVAEPTPSDRYELFWSLNFAMTCEDFARVGRFDEGYRGYGGEDTDFAFAARAAGVPFGFCPAMAFHQHHESHDPPLQHVDSIVENARRFHSKWGIWPMEKWLLEFHRRGLVEYDPSTDRLELREEQNHAASS